MKKKNIDIDLLTLGFELIQYSFPSCLQISSFIADHHNPPSRSIKEPGSSNPLQLKQCRKLIVVHSRKRLYCNTLSLKIRIRRTLLDRRYSRLEIGISIIRQERRQRNETACLETSLKVHLDFLIRILWI